VSLMSEEKTNPVSTQEKLARMMKNIGVDLWGAGAAPEAEAGRGAAEETGAGTEKGSARPAGMPGRVTAPREKVSLDNLWKTADETVDWTEALLRDTPRDGLTGIKQWSFYHRMAGRVLAGETDAYAEVLTTINPLGDLTEYVSGMILRTPSPERVECVFECQPDDLEQHGRDYLGALSLRIARDLLAILPVDEVKITGRHEGAEKVNVTFRREQLLKQKMSFLNPVDFAEACGGVFTLRERKEEN